MGLTHYWKRPIKLPANAFRAAAEDCRRLFREAGADLAGFEGSGDPTVNSERIVFNGRAPAACEPFEIAAVEFDRHGRSEVRSYCKTEHLPYDRFVRAALIVLQHHLQPAFRVSSDSKAEEWADARQLTQSVLGIGEGFVLDRD